MAWYSFMSVHAIQNGAFEPDIMMIASFCIACRAGVQRPEVEVRFENLSVSIEVLLGQQARQTLLNYYSNGITVSTCLYLQGTVLGLYTRCLASTAAHVSCCMAGYEWYYLSGVMCCTGWSVEVWTPARPEAAPADPGPGERCAAAWPHDPSLGPARLWQVYPAAGPGRAPALRWQSGGAGPLTLSCSHTAEHAAVMWHALWGAHGSERRWQLQVSGNVTYSGRKLSEFVVHRTAAYLEQQDIHIPHLTVREALNFSARCQGVGNHAGV